MNIARKLLVKGLAVVVVVAGVGSLITLGIMAGVKVAYAADSLGVLINDQSGGYILILDNSQKQGGLNRGLIKAGESNAADYEKIEHGYSQYPKTQRRARF